MAYAAHPYEDTNGYLKAFPLDQRKLGFYSHQPPNRDQFSKTLTTQQYRESIRRETRLTDAAIAAAATARGLGEEEGGAEEGVEAAIGAGETRAGAGGAGSPGRPHLYDLVHGEHKHDPDWQKTSRDVTFSIKTRPKEVPRVRRTMGRREGAGGARLLETPARRSVQRTGEHVVSSAAYGVGAAEVARPQHVRTSVDREFFNSGHVGDIGLSA